ncbi:hypothetical protein WMY93_032610 [Mugilogobius chulae]|uniref:Uncharacterized protein n=1 Tax=Mugilogobius chulae TaxID=88201 RepID=A0AAW0MU92_9GOBI
MSREKSKSQTASKLTATETDHDYQMDITSTSHKRKSPKTPTKIPTPPNKMMAQVNDPNAALFDAIQNLTGKIEVLSAQLTATSDIIDKLSSRTDKNEADIMDCNSKIDKLTKSVPTLAKENEALKDRVLELERYKRCWNLKLRVDTVHRLGRREEGKHCQVIIQFTARVQRDGFWKATKNNKICKDLGIHFKEDFCQQDRDARAAVWPKMERARANGRNVYYRGPTGYIDGVRVTPD